MKTGSGKLDNMDSIRWQESATAEASAWLDVNGRATARDKEAYAAGHRKGWQDAVSTLALQGVVIRFDKKGGEK